MTSQLLNGKRKNIDWKGTYIAKINDILTELEHEGEKPSVRGMWYILVSRFKGVIANTRSIYTSFDHATIKARKGLEGYPTIEEDAFVDNIRRIIDIDDDFITGREQVDALIQDLKGAADSYTIHRWYKQPNYVEVWLEKDAVVSLFQNILRNGEVDRHVVIAPNRGWTSRTFVKKNINRLWHKLMQKDSYVKDIYILYFGDFDPSGLRMSHNLRIEILDSFKKLYWKAILRTKAIKEEDRQSTWTYYMSKIHFERVAIEEPQIIEFDLEDLTNPDPDTEAKLEGL